jgi:hypothetical protein
MSAGCAGDSGLSGRDVVFSLDRGYRRPLMTRGSTTLAIAVLAAVVAVLGVVPDFAGGVAVAFGALALCYAARYLWVGRFRTRLSAEGIEIRGYLDHFVPWSDVTGVEVTSAEATGLILSGPGSRRSMHVTEVDPSAQPQLSEQLVSQGDSASGFRSRLATVRVTRTSGHSLLLRAPLVTAWQSDPEFNDKVRLIRQWWQAYGKGTFGAVGPTTSG